MARRTAPQAMSASINNPQLAVYQPRGHVLVDAGVDVGKVALGERKNSIALLKVINVVLGFF